MYKPGLSKPNALNIKLQFLFLFIGYLQYMVVVVHWLLEIFFICLEYPFE